MYAAHVCRKLCSFFTEKNITIAVVVMMVVNNLDKDDTGYKAKSTVLNWIF
jgi:hypothetical protein